MTDKALRQALHQQAEQPSWQMPSNFAYTTMQRIAQKQKADERRERFVAFLSVAACAILGITVIVVFYGAALKTALLAMCRQTDALAVLPVMTFCAVFFALLNRYLRRRFAVR